MSEYGLTPQGPNIKRLDTILEDLHTSLSEKWGVNTKQNPESLLNHLLTNIADSIAELWEFGEHVYYSQYPSSAEGISLDNAAQYGGSTREAALKSYYPIHCTGKDGTMLAEGTMISSATNPATYLTLGEKKEISRNSFNQVGIKIASIKSGGVYTVAINGEVYSYTSSSTTPGEILNGISQAIKSKEFKTSIDETTDILKIEASDQISSNSLILSENLTTDTVTSIVNFGTVDYGDILLPDGVITNIVKADPGLMEVVNINGYIPGRKVETDAEFRKSYADKIFNRSSTMLESIRSAILNKVQGAVSVSPYENESDEVDEEGRPPHSIEIVVDGGDSREIAQEIYAKKAGGISTFGSTAVQIVGEYDDEITIYFNRPTPVYVWYKLSITLNPTEKLPTNYVEILRNIVLDRMKNLPAGADVIPQKFMSEFYKNCRGISYIEITLFRSTDKSTSPTSYPDKSENITARQKAFTSADMIEVTING